MIPKSQGFPRMSMATKADAQKVPVLCTSESPKISGDFFFSFLAIFHTISSSQQAYPSSSLGAQGHVSPQRCVVLSVLQTKLPQVPCCLQSLQVYQSKSSRCLWAGRMPGSRERSCVREREDSSAWVLDLLTFHLGKQETMMLLTWSDSCCCCMKIEMLPSA